MEIERKFLVTRLPENLDSYPHDKISQAYISTDPVIRIRQKNEDYILTVKSSGLLAREEVEMPLTKESFSHLMTKAEGVLIEKTRYKIPDLSGLLMELDLFHGVYDGFIMAEVEFPDLQTAQSYNPPPWFGPEVTQNPEYHNSRLSKRSKEEISAFLHR